MTPDEMIEVIQAWKDGKQIQASAKGRNQWVDSEDPNWGFATTDYRIKPEPKKPIEVVMFVREDGVVTPVLEYGQSGRAAKFREVLE